MNRCIHWRQGLTSEYREPFPFMWTSGDEATQLIKGYLSKVTPDGLACINAIQHGDIVEDNDFWQSVDGRRRKREWWDVPNTAGVYLIGICGIAQKAIASAYQPITEMGREHHEILYVGESAMMRQRLVQFCPANKWNGGSEYRRWQKFCVYTKDIIGANFEEFSWIMTIETNDRNRLEEQLITVIKPRFNTATA